MMTKGCGAFLIAGSGLPEVENHGAATKNVAAARKNDGATKNTRAQEETSPGPLADTRPLSWGPAAPTARARARGPEFSARHELGFEQQNSFRNTEN